MTTYCVFIVASAIIVFGGTLLVDNSSAGYGTIKEISITGVQKLNLSQDLIVHIAANSKKGFNFPYYLFVPKSVDRNNSIRLLVESNNTGTSSDDFKIHDQRAKELARDSHVNKIARKLNVPLLIPVFPRPQKQWQMYTQALDEDTLLVKSGAFKRIDLQLVQMIKNAQKLLSTNNIKVKDKVFMHGFSASSAFANRFSILQPRIVRAIAAGGVSGILTFPTVKWHDAVLRYPIGIADLQEMVGIDFNEKQYRQISQYIYMGYLDRNDTTLYRDAYDEEDAMLIRTLIGEEIPERWLVSRSIYNELGVSAQFVTYNGVAHWIREEMIDDIVKFFAANSGNSFVEIEPYQYPFVEYREIKKAHVNGLYWRGDERIPEWARDLAGRESFIICIEEWINGQEYQQLDIFKRKAGFNFVLKAEGYEDILIIEKNFHGTMSSNEGDFQGFVVILSPSELEKMDSGIEYKIVSIGESKGHSWIVREGVRLTRP